MVHTDRKTRLLIWRTQPEIKFEQVTSCFFRRKETITTQTQSRSWLWTIVDSSLVTRLWWFQVNSPPSFILPLSLPSSPFSSLTLWNNQTPLISSPSPSSHLLGLCWPQRLHRSCQTNPLKVIQQWKTSLDLCYASAGSSFLLLWLFSVQISSSKNRENWKITATRWNLIQIWSPLILLLLLWTPESLQSRMCRLSSSCRTAFTFRSTFNTLLMNPLPVDVLFTHFRSVCPNRQTERQAARWSVSRSVGCRPLSLSQQLQAFVWKSDLSCRLTPQFLLLLRPDIWSQTSPPPLPSLSLSVCFSFSLLLFFCLLKMKLEAKGKLERDSRGFILPLFHQTQAVSTIDSAPSETFFPPFLFFWLNLKAAD